MTLPTGATVLDVIDALKIPHEQATMLVAGDTYVEKTTPLTDGLQLNIFPPLAGGRGALLTSSLGVASSSSSEKN